MSNSSVCVCPDQYSHHHYQLLPSSSTETLLLRHIHIPPRKLLFARRAHQDSSATAADMYSNSSAEETFLQEFLPFNNGVDGDDHDSDADPYSSDHFRMYEFKVRPCTRSRSHDWTDCPFAHPGEKARRRDPRRHQYSGAVCPEYRRGGSCSRGDSCEFAHGVFECWLHPARYRTEACKDGQNCKRKVCFFAHTPRQLRVLPPSLHSHSSPSPTKKNKHLSSLSPAGSNHCCVFCCHSSTTSSPTSTLLGMSHLSPPLSPPLSPANRGGFSPISRYGSDRIHGSCGGNANSCKDMLADLECSLEAMNFSETDSLPVSSAANNRRNLPWVDVSFNNDDQLMQQFILSPNHPSGCGKFFGEDCSINKSFNNNINIIDDHKQLNSVNNNFAASCSDPDLGWVNELLM